MRDQNLAFFEAAAQVIPVLALAVILEGRFIKGASGGGFPYVLFTLLLMAAGEWLAMRVLLRGHATSTDRAWVSGALVAAGIGVVIPPLVEAVQRFRRTRATKSRVEWLLEGAAALPGLALIVYIILTT